MHDPTKDISAHLKQQYGITLTKIQNLEGGVVNNNFYVADEQGKEYVFKIYMLHNKEHVSYEHAVLEKLAEIDFKSPRIVQTLNGHSQTPFQKHPSVLFRYLPGSTLAVVTPEAIATIGSLLGRIHSKLEPLSHTNYVETWEPRDVRQLMAEKREEILTRPIVDIHKSVAFIEDELNSLTLPDSLPKGVTHQDVKSANIVVDENGNLSLIDFNNVYHGTLLYDALTPLIWEAFDENGVIQIDLVESYLVGYTSTRSFEPDERAAFVDAIKFRILREAIVWPLRWLDGDEAQKKLHHFLSVYREVVRNQNKIVVP